MFTVFPKNEKEPWQDFSTQQEAEAYAAELAAKEIASEIEETAGEVI